MIVADRYIVKVRAFEATPANVRFSTPVAPVTRNPEVSTTVRYGRQLFVKFYAAPIAPPSGSPVYPVVGHVRAPDTYGPTGADYQGTEVLPAAADVKTGVGYGAGGTEFTGTLPAGAGGVSRGRAVN